MYDIIIVGAGPAGLTSALYGARAGKNILVLEANSYGGQIINASTVENYPGISSISGFDLATNLYNQVKDLVTIKYEEVISIEPNMVITKNNKYETKNIIIATGCSNRKLNLGEERLIGRGISYCATCDGNFYKGKDVMVVGGGNTALEDAIYLSNIVNKVYLVHRRDSFRGEDKLLEDIKNKDNIEIIINSTIKNINGNDKLESIDIVNTNNEERNINVSGLFIAIGQVPNSGFVANILDLDKYGYIKSDDTTTNIDSIYVVGDVREKEVRQLTTSCSDGAIAIAKIINK